VYGKVGGRLPNAFREVVQLFEGKLSKALSAWISLEFSVNTHHRIENGVCPVIHMEGEVCMELITALLLSDLDSPHSVYFRYVEVTSITSSVTGQSVSIPLLKTLAQRMTYQRGSHCRII